MFACGPSCSVSSCWNLRSLATSRQRFRASAWRLARALGAGITGCCSSDRNGEVDRPKARCAAEVPHGWRSLAASLMITATMTSRSAKVRRCCAPRRARSAASRTVRIKRSTAACRSEAYAGVASFRSKCRSIASKNARDRNSPPLSEMPRAGAPNTSSHRHMNASRTLVASRLAIRTAIGYSVPRHTATSQNLPASFITSSSTSSLNGVSLKSRRGTRWRCMYSAVLQLHWAMTSRYQPRACCKFGTRARFSRFFS